jgi:hypothetical protein
MRALRSGDPCSETGLYVASCGCGVAQRVTRQNVMPKCLICEREVVWYGREVVKEHFRSAHEIPKESRT